MANQRSRWEGRKRHCPHGGPPTPALTLEFCIKTPARNNSLELKVAQLKEKAQLHCIVRTEVCTCHVENNRN